MNENYPVAVKKYSSIMSSVANALFLIAFEGLSHPYRQNIVKFGNTPVMGNLSEIRETLIKAKTE